MPRLWPVVTWTAPDGAIGSAVLPADALQADIDATIREAVAQGGTRIVVRFCDDAGHCRHRADYT